MKNELGIEICCANCIVKDSTRLRQVCDCEYCRKNEYAFYHTKDEIYRNRIRELQEIEFENKLEKSHLQKEIEKAYDFISKLKEKLQEQQFTKKEAEKIETFLIHGYQMMINENKKIFSKLKKMKGK